MPDLKTVPGPAWYIVVGSASLATFVLCVAFTISFQTARTEHCKQHFLGLELGPERECAPIAPGASVLPAEKAVSVLSFLDRRWCDVSPARKEDEDYTNEAAYPIEIAVGTRHAFKDPRNFCRLAVTVRDQRGDSQRIVEQVNNNPEWHKKCSVTVTIPPGATYRVTANSDVPAQAGVDGDGEHRGLA